MKNSLLYLAAATTSLAIPMTAAQSAAVQINVQNPVVEIQVSESISAAPDVATFSTGVSTLAPTATAALRQNSQKVRVLVNRIKELGISEKDIQTSGINLNAEYEYVQPSRTQKFKGYRVRNNVQVKVRDIARLGTILDAVIGAGATELNGPNFSLEDDERVKATARANAFKRGGEQALAYAKAAGYSGIKLLSVGERISGQYFGPPPVSSLRVVSMQEAAPVEPGQVATAVNISLQYEMVR